MALGKTASAVVTKNCPDTVKADFSKFKIITADQLETVMSEADKEDGEMEKARQYIESLTAVKVPTLKLEDPVETAKKGRKSVCVYLSEKKGGPGARFYTKKNYKTHKSQAILRFDVPSGEENYGFYVTVKEYDKESGWTSYEKQAGIMLEESDPDANFSPQPYGTARSVKLAK